ncbi:MAG: DNA-binding response regulator [Flavobacteriales bacterium]|nr:MAG: DNA-binding response regulator [Flavobacteriales bacterium]PIE49528.1 MAG: DNA-binding response regulator [Flavobacteriales bacterium]
MSRTKIKILIADDEPDILELLRYNLAKEGYEVHLAANGEEAVDKANAICPNLIVLDVMMPVKDGIKACKEIRALPKFKNTLITFLSARGEDLKKIEGLEAGADDYIVKPIRPKVFLSKVKSLLRRLQAEELTAENIRKVGDIVIDKEHYIVKQNKKSFEMPKKEFELLALLSEKPGKVYTREFILESVWGSDVVVGDRTIDVHIRKLREKLGAKIIKTVKGVGYKFNE